MAAAVWLAPVHDVGEPALGPAAGRPRHLGRDTTAPVGTATVAPVPAVNQPATSSMLSQYSRAEDAAVPVTQ